MQLHDSFFQVPLTGPAAQNFKSVNVREHNMLGQVLPELQHFIETNCTGQTHEIMKYGMATLSPVPYVSMFVSQSYLCNQ